MSEEATVESLGQELRAAQELLFLVLDQIGEPVVINIDEAKNVMKQERMIDLQLDDESNNWVVSVVKV